MKGLGSLFAGVLLRFLDIDDIFLVFAGLGTGTCLILLLVYHTCGKRSERRLVQEKQELWEKAQASVAKAHEDLEKSSEKSEKSEKSDD